MIAEETEMLFARPVEIVIKGVTPPTGRQWQSLSWSMRRRRLGDLAFMVRTGWPPPHMALKRCHILGEITVPHRALMPDYADAAMGFRQALIPALQRAGVIAHTSYSAIGCPVLVLRHRPGERSTRILVDPVEDRVRPHGAFPQQEARRCTSLWSDPEETVPARLSDLVSWAVIWVAASVWAIEILRWAAGR